MESFCRTARLVAASLAVAFALACVSLPSPTGEPVTAPAPEHLEFEFPDEIPPFNLTGFEVYENSELGAIANYRIASDPLISISLYIFPAPRFEDGSIVPLADHAQNELFGLLRHYEGAQQIEWPPELVLNYPSELVLFQLDREMLGLTGDANISVRVTGDGKLAPEFPRDISVYQGALTFDHAGAGTLISLIGVFEVKDARMKLRISYPAATPTATLSIRQFLESFK